MADEDHVLEEKADTLPDSQPEEKTPEEGTGNDTKVVKKPEPEAAWEGLAGSTQDRVVELVRRAKLAEAEKLRLEAELSRTKSQPVTTHTETTDVDVQEAVRKLKEYGIVTKDDLTAIQDRLYLEREHDRLERKYSGEAGKPKYNREEVEDYARSHYFGGNLESAYKDMYWDELVDAEVKNRAPKHDTYTERPTASVKVGEKPLTVDSLRERLRQPDGAEWWAKNREKIEPLLEKLSRNG